MYITLIETYKYCVNVIVTDNMAKKVKYGRIGAPHSAKRKAWMKKISKKKRGRK